MKKHTLIVLFVVFSFISIKGMTLSEIRDSFYTIATNGFKKPNFFEKDINKLPKEFMTKFVVKNGLIFVNANLDGSERFFLLDSGLGCNLILNSDAKFVDNLNASEICISGMGGGKCKEMETSKINTFQWEGIKISDTEVVAMPLSNISKENNFAGIIGFDLFKNYQLTFDYQHDILKAEIRKDLEKEEKENGKLISVIPFELKDHMPVFDVDINGKKYKVGLDTGASVNAMNKKYFDELTGTLSNIQEAPMKGFGGESKVKRGLVKQTIIGGLHYDNMNFNFDSSSLNNLNKQYKYGIDGLIGYEFLNKYITVVDFNSKEIRIYDGRII